MTFPDHPINGFTVISGCNNNRPPVGRTGHAGRKLPKVATRRPETRRGSLEFGRESFNL